MVLSFALPRTSCPYIATQFFVRDRRPIHTKVVKGTRNSHSRYRIGISTTKLRSAPSTNLGNIRRDVTSLANVLTFLGLLTTAVRTLRTNEFQQCELWQQCVTDPREWDTAGWLEGSFSCLSCISPNKYAKTARRSSIVFLPTLREIFSLKYTYKSWPTRREAIRQEECIGQHLAPRFKQQIPQTSHVHW